MRISKLLLICLILMLNFISVYADVPTIINYQGMLKDNGVPVNGTKSVVFKLYDASTGGNILWTSPEENITVVDGLYTYKIGSAAGTPDFAALNWSQLSSVYLEIVVAGVSISPRVQLVSVPFALTSSTVVDESITTSKIADNAITLNKLNESLKTGSGLGLVPTGCIMMWPNSNPPTGWFECNGQSLNKNDYPELFAAIGYTYGGSSDVFHLPDLKNQFVRGWDHIRSFGNSGIQSDSTRNPGFTYTFTSVATHSHGWTAHAFQEPGFVWAPHSAVPANCVSGHFDAANDSTYHNNTVVGGGDTETRPKNIALMYIIKK